MKIKFNDKTLFAMLANDEFYDNAIYNILAGPFSRFYYKYLKQFQFSVIKMTSNRARKVLNQAISSQWTFYMLNFIFVLKSDLTHNR